MKTNPGKCAGVVLCICGCFGHGLHLSAEGVQLVVRCVQVLEDLIHSVCTIYS